MAKDDKKLEPAKTGKLKPKAEIEEKPKARKETSKLISEVKAKANYIRVAPRKVRLVIDQLKGLEAEKALDYLKFVNKAATRPITKLLSSAVANAENNFKLDKKDLYIKKIIVNDGPVLKRFRPRAHGRSAAIRKRTSHIELILGVRPGSKQKIAVKKETFKGASAEEVKVIRPEEIKKEALKIAGKSSEGKGKEKKGFIKGIFQRKTG